MKKILIMLFLCMAFAQTALAQTVTVDGVGVDRDSAMRDAARMAVEQVAGMYINSNTVVSNTSVEMDEILSHAQGYVQNITVISESMNGGEYRVRASVDVNTDPNSAFMKRMDAVMRLSDPRIGVVILSDDADLDHSFDGLPGHDTILETALNERLLTVGFKHVVDVNLLSQLQDSSVLNAVYRGDSRLPYDGDASARPIDYLVIGRSHAEGYKVKLPDNHGGYVETQMSSARTHLDLKIISFGTSTIIGTYSVDGQGVENSPALAARKSRQAAAGKAAEKLEQQFLKAAASGFSGIQLTVRANDFSLVEKLVRELKELRGVQDVYVRGTSAGKTTIDIASAQKPFTILQMLQRETDLSIFVESTSDSELKIALR
ncbi:hypothetical protein HMPREF9334_00812 [Selenomonas infelix ATCC 43532]|uniref:Flagellar assembly protein T N-terminal domain-containing protein n=1 Tax=Selenomonas infelix ATCC 43532 TaxID=679201 RepID=G5GP08_9FIRM|nr:hypothetical protein [Selenomonas infelix]EHG21395.1 hypothetical protein HMPREF9334_00812 [Selenomonas infelix ATCC 43532]